MELGGFLRQTQTDVRASVNDRRGDGGNYPFPESVFAEVVMEHMSEIGMTFEPAICHYTARVGNARLRLSGYAVSDEQDQLDLFVSLYAGVDEIHPIPDSETKKAAEQCLRFLAKSADGTLAAKMEESDDAYSLTITIQGCYDKLDQIRIYVLTDRRAKAKNFKPREIHGKTVKLEVVDIERLYHHWSTGKPRDELTVDFAEVTGGALPCIYVPGEMSEYDYAMTALPGEALRFVYDKYGDRLLEANVRSFLSVTGKVNRGIRDTLRSAPQRFMAYNNGIVIVTDDLRLGTTPDGGPGILWMRGMQVVNGGQTTASLFFSQRKHPNEIDLAHVRVPAKIIVLKTSDPVAEEEFIANISKYANSQNNVKQSDLSANKRFHREVENLASTTVCPDGVGRWFYERAAGSYKTMLARDGNTPARLRKLRQAIPPARKITKTDLAKYLNAWAQLPHVVRLGAQKNFVAFMDRMTAADDHSSAQGVDVKVFKRMIAKAIIYRTTQRMTRGRFPAFQANVVSYTVAIVACRLRPRLDLDTLVETGRLPIVDRLGNIDLILASPECRSHTCARGSGQRDENSRRTARYVLRFARQLKPRWIVIENVIHMRNWDGFGGLIAETEALGYHVHAQVLDASTFGVPQKRRRLFLICDREEMPHPVIPPGGTPRSVKSGVVIWDGPWRSSPLYSARRADATIEKAERAIDALGRGTPFLIVYYGSDGGGGWQSIDVPLRTVTTIDRFGLVTWVDNVPMLRMLQPPEIQRAMGFGHEYQLPHGSRRDRIRILGNAVCPPVMTAVVTSALRDRAASARRAA